MGCKVAGGPKGRQLLLSLANLWRVQVTAGQMTQYSYAMGKDLTFTLEGAVISCFPE